MLGEAINTVFSGFVLRARPISKDPLEISFKQYAFFTDFFRSEMIKKSSMTTRALTSGTAIRKMMFSFPENTTEQKQIGSFFQNLDNLITLHQKKYDKLIILKKAMLVKMFPKNGDVVPEIRFKGFTEDWEEKTFGNEVDFFSGLTYAPNNVVRKGGTLVLRSSNVKNGQIILSDNVFVDSDFINCDNVKVGDIIVVVRNGSRSLIGKHSVVKNQMKKTVIGAFMTGLRPKQSDFINSLLDTNQFNKEIEKNIGATINQITNGAFKSMLFMFPLPKEQQKIGDYFKNLDNQIALHQTQLDKLKNIKKACFTKMFVAQD